MNIGGGIQGYFNENVGIRGDIRYPIVPGQRARREFDLALRVSTSGAEPSVSRSAGRKRGRREVPRVRTSPLLAFPKPLAKPS